MIEIRNISLSFGARTIFNEINAVVNKGDRIGLVGSNGAGKSTLLKILCGLEHSDAGEIAKPKYATVGYLPQDAIVVGSRPLFDEVESAFDNVIALREKMAEVDSVLAEANASSTEYAEATVPPLCCGADGAVASGHTDRFLEPAPDGNHAFK